MSDLKNTQPEGTAARFNSGKLRFGLIPVEAEIELARVYTLGALKYDDDNWLKGGSWKTNYDSLRRHLAQFWAGESIDQDTRCHHLAQVAWNAIALMLYDMHDLGTDDRRKVSINSDFRYTGVKTLTADMVGMDADEIQAFSEKYSASSR